MRSMIIIPGRTSVAFSATSVRRDFDEQRSLSRNGKKALGHGAEKRGELRLEAVDEHVATELTH